MTVIGIDPGLKGGIAVVDIQGLVSCFVMPVLANSKGKDQLNEYALRDVLVAASTKAAFGDDRLHIFIEKQQTMHKQGVTSGGTTMYGFGFLVGLCVGGRRPHTIVRAKEWQKEMFKGLPKADPKVSSAIAAQRLYPEQNFKTKPSNKKLHDGLTDAALIATYGWRQLNGGG